MGLKLSVVLVQYVQRIVAEENSGSCLIVVTLVAQAKSPAFDSLYLLAPFCLITSNVSEVIEKLTHTYQRTPATCSELGMVTRYVVFCGP